MTGSRATGQGKNARQTDRAINTGREDQLKMVRRIAALGETPRNVTAEDLANEINALKRAIRGV